ncbi:MAG: ABC transporter substrate-binding protein [Leptolyngbyaceae cyanobacterium RU_5_1]|nr:ABC transporter substrate-binding protein [Leptolyngbyaceae cyanobacterium RU_5_1]
MIGELIGARYKVINVLGSGGFGRTYITEDTQRPGNPLCVLKHLTFSSTDPAVLQQVRRLFRAEAETLEQLGRHDQIPRLLAYFEEDQQFYLVQEFVAGHPLSDELVKGFQMSEDEVIPLLQDALGILEFVHAQGVIHRDIKPANLIRRQDGRLVLIDFGAVKTIGNTVAEVTGETNLSMPVYTSGYAASEQCLGRPRFSSDIYSLGMVGIQALTGLHPAQLPHDYGTSDVVWRNRAIASDELATVIDTMVRYHFAERYQSASDALQALRHVIMTAPTIVLNATAASTPPNSSAPDSFDRTFVRPAIGRSHAAQSASFQNKKTLTRMGLAILGTATVAILVRSFAEAPVSLPWASQTISPIANEIRDRISSGEKLLNKWRLASSKKQEGINQFAAGHYDQSVAILEVARQQNRSDPEILIYLNNARIGAKKSYLIAVVAPLGNTLDSALEILRGAAQAQDEINQAGGINGVPLRVEIADDNNQIELAQQIAETLANDPNVLGVVGHGISDTTLTAAKVYQEKQLVMVSPVSSAVQLAESGDYIFLTTPTDRQTAKALKDYMMNHLNKRRVVIFHNSNSTYSQSLKDEFKDALYYSSVKDANVVDEIDLSQPDFDAEESVHQAIANNRADVLMLATDAAVIEKAIRVIESNNRRLPVLAGDSLFAFKVPKIAKEKAVGTVFAVPIDLTGSPFLQRSVKLWGQGNLMSWRTALSYDATKTLIAAISRNQTRSGIQQAMSQSDFSAPGAKGTVNFKPRAIARRNRPT